MSKHRVAVLNVIAKQRSVTAAAADYGISRQHLQRLLSRYREGGLEALEPRSRRPHASPGRLPDIVRARIVALRTELTGRGLDAGPVTIAAHDTGLTLPPHRIAAHLGSWRNTRRAPGRGRGTQATR
jgi:hypothetical protein